MAMRMAVMKFACAEVKKVKVGLKTLKTASFYSQTHHGKLQTHHGKSRAHHSKLRMHHFWLGGDWD